MASAAVPGQLSAISTPLHVVVSERGEHSEIHVLRVPAAGVEAWDSPFELGQVRARISQAIERIAMRALLGA